MKRFVNIFITFNFVICICIFFTVKCGLFNKITDVDYLIKDDIKEVLELSDNDDIIFKMKNNLVSIDNIILQFSGYKPNYQGNLKVRIYDEEKEYYQYEIPINKLTGDVFYLYTKSLNELRKNTQFYLSVAVENLGTDKIILSCVNKSYFKVLSVKGEGRKFSRQSPIIGVNGSTIILSSFFGLVIFLWTFINLLYIVIVLIRLKEIKTNKKNKLRILGENIWVKTKELPKYFKVHLGILLILFVSTIVASFYFKEDLINENKYEYWTHNSVSEFNNIPVKNGQIVQSFEAGYNLFDQFILIFDNYTANDTAKLTVELSDIAGEVYYSWNGYVANIAGQTYYLMAQPQCELKKGKEYYLKISLDQPGSDITVKAVSGSNLHESLNTLTINNEEIPKTALYLCQKYHTTFSYLVIWYCILGITFLVTVLIIYSNNIRRHSIIRGIMIVVLLVACFCIIENLSGNLNVILFKYVVVNCLILFGIFLIINALLGKWAYYLTAIISLIVGLVNYYVIQFRGTELMYTDIKSFTTAISVAGNYEFAVSPVVYTSILLMLSVLCMEFAVDKKCESIKQKHKGKKAVELVSGLLFLLLIGNVFTSMEKSGFNNFTLSSSFAKFGWCYANTFLIKLSTIEKPQGYSIKQVEELILSIDENTENDNIIIPKNLIVIMNESFSDLGIIGQLNTNKDYMPFINSLDKNTIKGNLHVSTFGGNTCITEYEFLTGNTQHFLPKGSIPYTSICEKYEESLCRILKKQNYYTIAMHPYGAANWNRDKVYPAMGFDEFLDIEDYKDAELIRNYVSDKADYKKIINYYESFDKTENLFIFNVTMQNHGGYDVNNGVIDKSITINNFDSGIGENYLSLVYESDKAFEYLLSYFSNVEEPTMIVMFGDHLPSLPESFYEELYGKALSDRNDIEKSKQYITPYIIWTNYNSQFEKIENISANYLGSYILSCAGLKMSKYNKFLLYQRSIIPVIGKYGLYNNSGKYTIYQNVATDLLTDYQNLQYMRIKDRKSLLYNIFYDIEY